MTFLLTRVILNKKLLYHTFPLFGSSQQAKVDSRGLDRRDNIRLVLLS